MNNMCCPRQKDYGANPYVINVENMACQNPNFRTAIWTGKHLQMTFMRICPCEDIGPEIHENTDQVIRIEQGTAMIMMGKCRNNLDFCRMMHKGDAVFVPAGFWHNIINKGCTPLEVSSVYAPPQHPRGTIHRTKAEAE